MNASCDIHLTLRAIDIFITLGYRGMCGSECFVVGLKVLYKVQRLFSFNLDANIIIIIIIIAVAIGY